MPRESFSAKLILSIITWIMLLVGTLAITDLSPFFKTFIVGVSADLIAFYLGISYIHNFRSETAFYSPIHAMIVRINSEIPRKQALYAQNIVGYRLSASLINSREVSETFSQHSDKFSDKDLEIWKKIEEEIKRENHFYLGNDRQKWFDKLEAKYRR